MKKRTFNKLQKEGLRELEKHKKSNSWWEQGPRYTLQFWRGSDDRKGRVYIASETVYGTIPSVAYYDGKKYVLDLDSIKEVDMPVHFVPYVRFGGR